MRRATLFLFAILPLGLARCETEATPGNLASEIRRTTPVGNDPLIPFESLPAPGQCRIWYPGRSPLEQPSSGACTDLLKNVPPGAWLVYRPAETPQFIQIREYPVQPDGIVVVRNYDARTGTYIGSDTPATTRRPIPGLPSNR
jgi:hypothetical protein